MTSGPDDPPPWRGIISAGDIGRQLSPSGPELPFEVAPQRSGTSSAPFVFRTENVVWLAVTEWRELEAGAQDCTPCDRQARQVELIIDALSPPRATDDDVAILRRALADLDKIAQWDRTTMHDCAKSDLRHTGLYCLLAGTVERRMGRYHHAQPALNFVRTIINERWPERITGPRIPAFNNHPATTMADVRLVLELALARARAEASTERR